MSGPGQGYSLPWASPVQTPGEGVRLWGNMLHIYIDKYMGKPSRWVLTPTLRLGGPAQSGPIGPP